jgi:hypothetical protein
MADSPTPVVNAAFALTVLSYLIILSRTLFRRLKHEAFKPDDYLILASMVIYAAYTGTFIVAVSLPCTGSEPHGSISGGRAEAMTGISWYQHQSNKCRALEGGPGPIWYSLPNCGLHIQSSDKYSSRDWIQVPPHQPHLLHFIPLDPEGLPGMSESP